MIEKKDTTRSLLNEDIWKKIAQPLLDNTIGDVVVIYHKGHGFSFDSSEESIANLIRTILSL